MRVLRKALLGIILTTIAGILPLTVAAEEPTDSPSVPVQVAIDSINVKDVASDRVRLQILSHLTASRKLKIKSVRFEHMRLGSLPVYLSPIEDRIELEKDVPVSLPPLPLTVYFRDLDSLEPLQQAVRDGKATVQGKARIDLELNLLEELAIRQRSARVDLPIAMTIPVEIPGGFAGRAAALATLTAGQVALSLGGSALNLLRQSQKGWEDRLRTQLTPALLVADSRYSIRTHDNQKIDFSVRGLGFRISPDQFVLTGEMIEPWKYDTDVARALQTGEASLIEDSIDLLVYPAGETPSQSSSRSLSIGTIQIVHRSGKIDVAHVPYHDKSIKVPISQRDADANYAVLRFARTEDKLASGKEPPIQLAPEQFRRSRNWDRLTLFRVDDEGHLELVSTPAHRKDNRIVLENPVDDRAYGSLLIAPEGSVGMVQDERTGMLLRPEW
jgi:hypothetical protein